MPNTTTRVISTTSENVPVPVDRNGYPIPAKKRSGKPSKIGGFFQKLGDSIDDALNRGNDVFSQKHPQQNLMGTKTTTVTETLTTNDDGTVIKIITTTVQHPNGAKDVSEQRTVIPPGQQPAPALPQATAPYKPAEGNDTHNNTTSEPEIVVPMATAIPIPSEEATAQEAEIVVPAASAPYEDKPYK